MRHIIVQIIVRSVVLAAVCALLILSALAIAAEATGAIHGTVADSSGGVLPGVTIVATSLEGQTLATAVSDGSGDYALSALPAGPVDVTFRLDGFETAVVRMAVESNDAPRQADVQRLEVARVSETVMVYGKIPVPPPPPPPPLQAPLPLRAPDPAPVARVLAPVPEHDPASVCGPAKPEGTPIGLGTVRALHHDPRRLLYSKSDEVVIERGSAGDLDVGRNLVVRRHYSIRGVAGDATGEHTAGLVQIVSVDGQAATAVVVYACDEIRKGDFLAEFRPEPLAAPDAAGVPAFYDAARILFADEGQMLGVSQRLMVIDRGTNHGIAPGQRLTVFRRAARDDHHPRVLGDAVVIATRTESATIRIDQATEAIAFGDWAASQRATGVSRDASIR